MAQRRGILTGGDLKKVWGFGCPPANCIMMSSLKRQLKPHLRFCVNGRGLFTGKLPSPLP